jgi:2-amino-4-hydroxy-6-hydroxymethyldihydropteridine diphosphokinase
MPDHSRIAVVALGSNLGDSTALIERAISILENLSEQPVLRSSLHESKPVDCPPGSPDFLNAIVAITPSSSETPESLLVKLQEIEGELGRRPKKLVNEPRPIDLDMVAFGSQIRNTEFLMLPHPRAHLRTFVLAPLAEILPDFFAPGWSGTVSELLARKPGAEAAK